MDAILERIKKSGHTPRLFLHSCCAPCSSYVLEYLSEYFEITDFFPDLDVNTERIEEEDTCLIKRTAGEQGPLLILLTRLSLPCKSKERK